MKINIDYTCIYNMNAIARRLCVARVSSIVSLACRSHVARMSRLVVAHVSHMRSHLCVGVSHMCCSDRRTYLLTCVRSCVACLVAVAVLACRCVAHVSRACVARMCRALGRTYMSVCRSCVVRAFRRLLTAHSHAYIYLFVLRLTERT